MTAMDENLVGYLLNALDDETHREVARYVEDHPEARTRLDRLRQALAPLEADRDSEEPPRGLAARTLARLEDYHSPDLPRAPVTAAARAPGVRWGGWRWPDALVAAAVLLVAAGLLLSLRSKMVFYAELRACENNQRGFWFACAHYRDLAREPGGFPNVAAEPEPLNVAGIAAPVLIQAGVLNPGQFSVYCPSKGHNRPCPWSLEQLQRMSTDEFNRCAPDLLCCYAYSLGYLDEKGRTQGPCVDDPFLPILADRPPRDGSGNSPNHGGFGQNVLLVNGQVRYFTTRCAGRDGDDIYSNRRNEVRAGLDRWDTVLGSSADRP
jgi:hypothetical protein